MKRMVWVAGLLTVLLVVLVATTLLLALRAWSGVVGLKVTRRVSQFLDGSIATLLVLFLALVILRFRTVA